MMDYTGIIIDIIIYFVIFNDVYHVYTSQKLQHIIIFVNSVWSSITQFCGNFYYNFFRAQIAQYQ